MTGMPDPRPRIVTDRPGLTEAALVDAYAEAEEAAQRDGTVTELAMREGVMALIVPVSYAPPPPGRPGDGDPAAIAYLQDLYSRERDGERDTLAAGPYTAFVVIYGLQLAMRHPGMTPAMRGVLGEFTALVMSRFDGTPGEELLRAGDDPPGGVPAAG